jgi:hypothetical protein
LLKILAKPNSRYREAILKNADKDLIYVLCVIIKDILDGKVKISETDREKLKKFRSTLHILVQKSSLSSKKKILIQKGILI